MAKDTTRVGFKKTFKPLIDTLLIFKTEEGPLEGLKDALIDTDLSVETSTEDMVTHISEAIITWGKTLTDEDVDKMTSITTAVTALEPILTDLIDWTKQFVGSHPTGIGGGDDE